MRPPAAPRRSPAFGNWMQVSHGPLIPYRLPPSGKLQLGKEMIHKGMCDTRQGAPVKDKGHPPPSVRCSNRQNPNADGAREPCRQRYPGWRSALLDVPYPEDACIRHATVRAEEQQRATRYPSQSDHEAILVPRSGTAERHSGYVHALLDKTFGRAPSRLRAPGRPGRLGCRQGLVPPTLQVLPLPQRLEDGF